MKALVLAVGLVLAFGTCQAWATPYWVAWEGNEFPENSGWQRVHSAMFPSQRQVTDGVLTIDSSQNERTYEYYEMPRLLDPSAGEVFRASWRLAVTMIASPFGLGDAGITIAGDRGASVVFTFIDNTIRSNREGWSHPISPGFHDYQLASADMNQYELLIDGQTVRQGNWLESLDESFVDFGDIGLGGGVRSISEWDYVRFGVVPEPHMMTIGFLVPWTLRRRR